MSFYVFLVSEFCGSMLWCFKALISYERLSEGFSNILFKYSVDFIQILFNEHIF